MRLLLPLALIALYALSIHFLMIRPKLDYWDIILIHIQFLSSFLAISSFLNPSKKKVLKKGRLRLQKHIDERKAWIKIIRERHNYDEKSKTVYGYPWWPWFK